VRRIKLLVFALFLSTFCHCKQPAYALAICAVFKNESFFIKEWIEFHRLMGAEHFYLYDNGSSDNSLEILEPYIQSGLVEVIDWSVETHDQREYLTLLQLPAYNDALCRVKQTAKWAAFIDLDEFICPMRHESIVAMLDEYNECAGLAINWQVFGTSFIDKIPFGHRITHDFIWKAPSGWEINKYIKVIIQPDTVHSFSQNPHYCLFYDGYHLVNSDKRILPLREVQPIVIDTVRIHHYWFGDRQWFLHNKLIRRKQWGIDIHPDYLDTFINSFNQEKDTAMHRFISRFPGLF
jgi:hypothetical protein